MSPRITLSQLPRDIKRIAHRALRLPLGIAPSPLRQHYKEVKQPSSKCDRLLRISATLIGGLFLLFYIPYTLFWRTLHLLSWRQTTHILNLISNAITASSKEYSQRA